MNRALSALRAQDREPENRRPLIDCAHVGCGSHAICRVKKPAGWANLCEFHYANDNLQESRDYCQKHGLTTIEKKMAHVRALVAKHRDPRAWMQNPKSQIAKQWRDEILGKKPAVREPGQDDEEREPEGITI